MDAPTPAGSSHDALARAFDLTPHFEPCEEAVASRKRPNGLWLGNLNQRRFAHYHRWMRTFNITRVWLLDQRDVVFTAHPFVDSTGALLMPHTDLALFEDRDRMTRFTAERVLGCADMSAEEMRLMDEQHRPHVCGGTIFGTAAAVLRMIDRLMVEFNRANAHAEPMCHENDQAVLNVMLWRMGVSGEGMHVSAELGAVDIVRKTYGVARTHACKSALAALRCAQHVCPRFADGVRADGLNDSGAIWHKWDRCGTQLPALVRKLYASASRWPEPSHTAGRPARCGLIHASAPGRPPPPRAGRAPS